MMDPNAAYAMQAQAHAQQQQQAAQQAQAAQAAQQQALVHQAMQQQMHAAQMGAPGMSGQMPSQMNNEFMQQLQMQQRAQWAAAMGMGVAMPGSSAQALPSTYGYQNKVAMPQDVSEEQPTFVNAKQYRRILKRRQARAKLEAMRKVPSARKPFLHKSRHDHACRRLRGPSGRFLTKAEMKAQIDREHKKSELKD